MVSLRIFFIFSIVLMSVISGESHAQLSKNSVFHKQKNHLKLQSSNSKMAIALLDMACVNKGGDPGLDLLLQREAKIPQHNTSLIQATTFNIENIPSKELNSILQSSCILGVEENHVVRTEQLSINDPLYEQQNFYRAVKFQEGRRLFLSPAFDPFKAVLIGIIDSGIDTKHPEFFGRLWRGSSGEIGYNFQNEGTVPEDDFGHGTHVSGLVAANINNGIGVVGMSAQAQLMVVKTQDNQGEGSLANLISGIRYAVDNGAEVLNISLSVTIDSPGLRDAIDYALERNVVVVTAAGNQGVEISPSQFSAPAGYANTRPGLISVGSIDGDTEELSWFSNYSEAYVKIAAPGSYQSDGILSTHINQNYRKSAGTSMSSPVVAGSVIQVISYLKTHHISWVPGVVEEILLNGSFSSEKLQGKIKNQKQLDFLKLGQHLVRRFQLSTTGGFDE